MTLPHQPPIVPPPVTDPFDQGLPGKDAPFDPDLNPELIDSAEADRLAAGADPDEE